MGILSGVMAATKQMSKKRKFVHDGVPYAELNEMLQKELAEDGYAGVEIRRTPMRTEIIIRATRTREVLGEKGQRIRELTSAVQKRFGFAENTVEMFAERVMNLPVGHGPGRVAQVQAPRWPPGAPRVLRCHQDCHGGWRSGYRGYCVG